MKNKIDMNREKRNGAKYRAEIFANQMDDLKRFLHDEINRGVNAAEVEGKLDSKIDKIITEVRDYERLEHLIEAKAKNAVSAVDKRAAFYISIIAAVIFIAGAIGWDRLVKSSSAPLGEGEHGRVRVDPQVLGIVLAHHAVFARKFEHGRVKGGADKENK